MTGAIWLRVALIATGQMDAAVAEFQLAVEADPSNPNARRLLEMARQDRARVTGVPPQ